MRKRGDLQTTGNGGFRLDNFSTELGNCSFCRKYRVESDNNQWNFQRQRYENFRSLGVPVSFGMETERRMETMTDERLSGHVIEVPTSFV